MREKYAQLEIFTASTAARRVTSSCLSIEEAIPTFMGVRRNFSRGGGNVDISLIIFQVAKDVVRVGFS